MTAKATVTITLGSRREAEALARALKPDSGDFLTVRVAGSMLTLQCRADSVMGLLRTLDDALAGVQAADVHRGGGEEE